MKDGNAEFNEIRCDRLVVGDKEKGFVVITVDEENEGPVLILSSKDANEGIVLGFKDGVPTLGMHTMEAKKNTALVELKLNEEGIPMLNLSKKGNEDKSVSEVNLGFNDNGDPRLFLSDRSGSKSKFIDMGIDDGGGIFLRIINREIEGGNFILRVDDDSAVMVMSSEARSKIGEGSWGIAIGTSSEESLIGIEGEEHVKRVPENKEENSEE